MGSVLIVSILLIGVGAFGESSNGHWKDYTDDTSGSRSGGGGVFSMSAKDLLEQYEDYENDLLESGFEKEPVVTTTSAPKQPQVYPKIKSSTEWPEFLEEPVDSYIIRGKSAELDCKVLNAVKAFFTCNGEAMAESVLHKERDSVDSKTGLIVKEVRLEVTRNTVEEFFGKYTCKCDAWSSKGLVSSRNVTIEMAYLRKEFEVPPYSQNVELGSQIQLRCHPPDGKPKPRIYWMKNRVEVRPSVDTNYIQAADGHLIIIQARADDAANFTCVAENVAATRMSPPARLKVVVTGGWSEWTSWSSCSSECGLGYQRRERFCNNPRPKFGGAYCLGPNYQKNKCFTKCQGGVYDPKTAVTEISGGWSEWSSWSPCNPDCSRSRMRSCDNPRPMNGGSECFGQDSISEQCTGGMCRDKRASTSESNKSRGEEQASTKEAQELYKTDFTLLVGLSVALIVFLVVTVTSINFLRRKGRSPSMYTMTNMNYRREFSSSDKGSSGYKDDEAARQLIEATTNFETSSPSPASNGHAGMDNNTKKSLVNIISNPAHHHASVSLNSSPFVDKKPKKTFLASALTLTSNLEVTPKHNNNNTNNLGVPQLSLAQISPGSPSEHQYDIPFSHINKQHLFFPKTNKSSSSKSSEDIDDNRLRQNRLNNVRHQQQQRRSNASSKSSENNSLNIGNSSNWRSCDVGPPSQQSQFLLQRGHHMTSVSASNSPMVMAKRNLAAMHHASRGDTDSEKSLSIYSESSRPDSSLFGDLLHFSSPKHSNQVSSSSVYKRLSMASSSNQILDDDPEACLAFATVTQQSGAKLTLSKVGVSLNIPPGALPDGLGEQEVFLAVMAEGGRDRPRLSENQTLVSPVILVGPPRLTFRKPVVLRFDHCAVLSGSQNTVQVSWELGLYHCDSTNEVLDDNEQEASSDSPWVKLATIQSEDQCESGILTDMDETSCCVMTNFFTRYCIVGQSGITGVAVKSLQMLSFVKPSSPSSVDLQLILFIVEDTKAAMEKAIKGAEKTGFSLLDVPKTIHFYDGGDDLVITTGECSTGWSLKPRSQQVVDFNQVWSSGSANLKVTFRLRHVDPSVSTVAFVISAFQPTRPEARQTVAVTFDCRMGPNATLRSHILGDDIELACLPISTVVRMRLCQLLDHPGQPGQNDWRALVAALRLEKHTAFFQEQKSPTECAINLWETHMQHQNYSSSDVTPAGKLMFDLRNVFRVIGRHDCASLLEDNIEPWM